LATPPGTQLTGPPLFLTIGSAGFGAFIGTKLLQILPRRVVTFIFIGVLFTTAARMSLFSEVSANPKAISVIIAGEFVMLGLLSGVLAGLLGVGGGVVMVPVMVIFFDTYDYCQRDLTCRDNSNSDYWN
jgi:uncharacterized membrane protein YfcA